MKGAAQEWQKDGCKESAGRGAGMAPRPGAWLGG